MPFVSGGFRFLKDWLFLLCTATYVLNRYWLKEAFHAAFLRNWFSDLLLVPCAVPVVLWIFRKVRLRAGTMPPSLKEIAWMLTVWSILFEWAGPRIVARATGDWRDVVMYWAGGVMAWCIWWLGQGEAGSEMFS